MSVGWRGWRRILAGVLLIGLVFSAPSTRDPILRGLGRALLVDEPVEPADVVVVPQWTGDAGAIDAADLIHAGIATRVAVLPAPQQPGQRELIRRGIHFPDEAAQMAELLRLLGVVEVELMPERAAGTGDEARVLVYWCEQQRFRSVIVVSAPDHSRRLHRVVRRLLPGRPLKVAIRSAHYASFDPDEWWRTRNGIRTGIVELQKLLLDVVRHPLS